MDVHYVAGSPRPSLLPFVTRYSGYRMRTEPGVHRGLPSRSLTLVVTLDGTVDLPDGSFSTLISGLHSYPVIITHSGFQHGVQIDLTPLGARVLFGVAAGELAFTSLDWDVVGAPGAEVLGRLRSAPTWAARFGVLDEVFSRLVTPVRLPAPEVRWAWERLALGASVSAIALDVGWSRQHLTSVFRREFGLTPKVLGRVMRFERAGMMLRGARRPSLAEVAAACGYTDQAHFTREWGAFAGTSPTTWMAEELPFVQDAAALEGAPSSA
ncbi:AraC family transcriptional regulator [Lentzea sp. NBRC 105346]|uniref:helix-turn-helix domain-containing protein n=1 Tax=Lentzea sp. NBRC 105346 TaxID=3032205 RepID=UPI002552CF44|nr:AraC family transcriptional regulator [Lentzea sp. NBRC 105346]